MCSALATQKKLSFLNIKRVSLLLAALTISACTSNQYLIEPDNARNFSSVKESVSVANQQQAEQLSILEKSGIYNIVSSSETDKNYTLSAMGSTLFAACPS